MAIGRYYRSHDTADDMPSKSSPANDALPLQVVGRRRASAKGRSGLFRRVLLRAWRVPLVIALVASGGLVGMYFQPPGLQFAMRMLHLEPGAGTSTPIAVPAPKNRSIPPLPAPVKAVYGLGRLLPLGDVAVVSAPSGGSDARISRLTVREGDRAKAGDVIAVLDNEATQRAAIESAQTLLAVREADLIRTRAAIHASAQEARAAVASAEIDAENARLVFGRTDHLYRRGIAAKAAWDRDHATHDRARRAIDRARATLSRYQGTGADAQPDVRLALSNVDAARAELRPARSDLSRAYVRAPQGGRILAIHVRPGERPGSRGIAEIGNTDRMMAKVEIYQSEIAAIRIGAPVTMTADALPEPLEGTVTRIGLQIKRQTLLEDDPAANTDGRVVEITVALAPASSRRASGLTNLQVRAKIAVESR